MITEVIEEAVCAGAGLEAACKQLGVSSRTLTRWRRDGGGEDRRNGPKTPASNRLTEAERKQILETANLPEYRNRSPRQIVPLLADKGIYIASESSFYRVLADNDQLTHRDRARRTRART